LRWQHRDPEFQTALRERRATMADAAAKRLHGLLDQAVWVVQRSLSSPEADPKLAMALLSALGVLERSRERGGTVPAPSSGVGVSEANEDAEVERVIEAVEAEAGGVERQVRAGG